MVMADNPSPELLVEIQEKLDQLEIVAIDFHEAQNHVDQVVDSLLTK